MNNLLSRNLISADFLLFQENQETRETFHITRDQLFSMIDFWKVLLVEKYNAKPGQKVLLEFNLTNAYYYSAIFAVWELGMIMIIDWPHAYSYEDATSYRMTMHGKLDFAIVYSGQADPNDKLFYSFWDYERNRLNSNTIITEKDFDNYVIQDRNKFNLVSKKIFSQPDMDAVWSASGGTTGLPKQVKIKHREIFLQAERLCKHLGFVSGENTLHVNNLHHGASMCYHFLPSFMISKNHYVFNADIKLGSEYYRKLSEYINERRINKVLLYSSESLTKFLTHTVKLQHKLDIITLFYVNKQCIELIKKKNISSIRNVFGDTTIGYGFLVKIVDQNTDPETYINNKIGPKLDDFFDFKIEDGYLYVKAVGLGETEWKTSKDKFELKNGFYYFYGRGTEFRICDEWINLGTIDKKITDLFGDDGGTIVIDNEEQQLYLAIWKQNDEAEQKFRQYLLESFQYVKLNKVAKDLDPVEYIVSRKIDRQKLLRYFRKIAE